MGAKLGFQTYTELAGTFNLLIDIVALQRCFLGTRAFSFAIIYCEVTPSQALENLNPFSSVLGQWGGFRVGPCASFHSKHACVLACF